MSGPLDPRYPAAFQRGYEGASASEVPARPVDVVGLPPVRSEGQGAAAPAPVLAPAPSQDSEPREDIDTGVNPFIVAAWTLSAVLVVVGVWGAYWAQRTMFFGYTDAQPSETLMITQFVLSSLAPAAIMAGFVGVLGLLLWHAAAWRRRALAALRHPEP